MASRELQGVIVPAITPVDEQDRVDERAYRQVIRRLVDAGVGAIFVGGSAGEGPLLVEREWDRMVAIAADETAGALPLLGGAMDTSVQKVKDKIKRLRQADYDYLVVTPTYYYTLRAPGEYFRLFGECAEAAAGREVVAYNIPSCAGSAIPIHVVCELARRGWIRYCKESSGDPAYFDRLMQDGPNAGLRVLQGDEARMADGLLAGAVGVVPVCANFEPQTFSQMCRAAGNGDVETLRRCQERICEIRSHLLLAQPSWIAGIKHAMSLLGIGNGRPVSPIEPLTGLEQQAQAAFVECCLLQVAGAPAI